MFTRSLPYSRCGAAPCARPALLLALLALTLAVLVLTPGRAAAQYTTLDDPNAVYGTYPQGINAQGQIVGLYTDSNYNQHGFLFSKGVYTTLDDPNGVYGNSATGINAQGQIVGWYNDLTLTHGFLWSKGVYTTLDDPIAGTGLYQGTAAYGINDQGQIMGEYFDNIGSGQHGFLLNP